MNAFTAYVTAAFRSLFPTAGINQFSHVSPRHVVQILFINNEAVGTVHQVKGKEDPKCEMYEWTMHFNLHGNDYIFVPHEGKVIHNATLRHIIKKSNDVPVYGWVIPKASAVKQPFVVDGVRVGMVYRDTPPEGQVVHRQYEMGGHMFFICLTSIVKPAVMEIILNNTSGLKGV